jgi:two-component system chemotaxis response regulator CheY
MERILIVDDSSTMRKIIARSLRQAGFDIGEIVEAEHGQAGLDKLNAQSFGLILTDINMPGTARPSSSSRPRAPNR